MQNSDISFTEMSDQISRTKSTKLQSKRRGSAREERRRSSVSQIESIVDTSMGAESRGLCLSTQMDWYTEGATDNLIKKDTGNVR